MVPGQAPIGREAPNYAVTAPCCRAVVALTFSKTQGVNVTGCYDYCTTIFTLRNIQVQVKPVKFGTILTTVVCQSISQLAA